MRPRVWVAAATFLAIGVGLGAWYARPIIQARRIGIAWRPTIRASHCTPFDGEVICMTAWPSTRIPPQLSTTVVYARVSRRLLSADRTWIVADSSTWSRMIDSTHRAIAAQGWETLPCDSSATGFPIAEAWRIGKRAEEVRLYAASTTTIRERGVQRYVSVRLMPFGAPGCGSRYVDRLLTPAESARRVREWLARQIGFQ